VRLGSCHAKGSSKSELALEVLLNRTFVIKDFVQSELTFVKLSHSFCVCGLKSINKGSKESFDTLSSQLCPPSKVNFVNPPKHCGATEASSKELDKLAVNTGFSIWLDFKK
jgi:hypothetical protein